MCVCVCVCVCVCIYIYVYEYIGLHLGHACMYAYASIYMTFRTSYPPRGWHKAFHMYTYTIQYNIYMCVCTRIYVCVYTNTNESMTKSKCARDTYHLHQ